MDGHISDLAEILFTSKGMSKTKKYRSTTSGSGARRSRSFGNGSFFQFSAERKIYISRSIFELLPKFQQF